MKIVLAGLVAATLLTTTALAATTNETLFQPDQWTMSLAGSGTIQTESPSDAAIGATLSLGRKVQVVIPSELGVRQTVAWADVNQGSTWAFNTTLYNDWRIVKVGNVEILAGARIGTTYGNTPMTWAGGPEAEVRLWMKKDVYTFVRGAYDFAFSNSGINSKDAVTLTVGVGFSF